MDVLMENWKDEYKGCFDNYAEDDDLLNDWIEQFENRISWKLFQKNFLCDSPRKEIVDAEGRKFQVPTLRTEDAEAMLAQFNDAIGWLREYVMQDMLYRYATKGDIELDEDVIWTWFPDAFKYEDSTGWDPDDDE